MRILWQPQVPEQGPPISLPIVPLIAEQSDEEDEALSDGDEQWMGDCEDDD
jgi:hypothetical protein